MTNYLPLSSQFSLGSDPYNVTRRYLSKLLTRHGLQGRTPLSLISGHPQTETRAPCVLLGWHVGQI